MHGARNAHPTNWRRIASDTSRRMPPFSVSRVRTARTPPVSPPQWAKLRIIWHLIRRLGRPGRGEVESRTVCPHSFSCGFITTERYKSFLVQRTYARYILRATAARYLPFSNIKFHLHEGVIEPSLFATFLFLTSNISVTYKRTYSDDVILFER